MSRAEMIRVYSPEGMPLDMRPRSYVHREGLWHRGTAVVVARNPEEVLLTRRAPYQTGAFRGMYQLSASEHNVDGESYEAAAVRCLMRELKIKKADIRHLDIKSLGPLAIDTPLEKLHAETFLCFYDRPVSHCREIDFVEYGGQSRIEELIGKSAAVPWTNQIFSMLTTNGGPLWKRNGSQPPRQESQA